MEEGVPISPKKQSRFQRMFACFVALKDGLMAGCRPVFGVDGCFLKSDSGGILLTIVRTNPNTYLFPFAITMVQATKASIPEPFGKKMEDMAAIDEDPVRWFVDKPSSKWSMSHFSTFSKCDTLLNNLCESFNAKILDGRDMKIVSMFNWLRKYLLSRLQTNRERARAKWKGQICPKIMKRLNKNVDLVIELIPLQADEYNFEITCNHEEQYAVNPLDHTCLTAISHPHAIAAIWVKVEEPMDYIDECYFVENSLRSYKHTIFPCNGMEILVDIKKLDPTPSKYGRKAERPKKMRRKSTEELQ
ncbi:hypothetical protein ACH5RR_015460 [Cinchona calisaya]|uniref:Uncharacterized protein n=1 Tax=Cinchona calisaya TaxID=153742 RepID=A0ABD2ZV34_9GENT